MNSAEKLCVGTLCVLIILGVALVLFPESCHTCYHKVVGGCCPPVLTYAVPDPEPAHQLNSYTFLDNPTKPVNHDPNNLSQVELSSLHQANSDDISDLRQGENPNLRSDGKPRSSYDVETGEAHLANSAALPGDTGRFGDFFIRSTEEDMTLALYNAGNRCDGAFCSWKDDISGDQTDFQNLRLNPLDTVGAEHLKGETSRSGAYIPLPYYDTYAFR